MKLKQKQQVVVALLLGLCLLFSLGYSPRPSFAASSSNPLFNGWFADPEIRIFNNRYYIYPTSADPHRFEAWVSADLTNWRNAGTILSVSDIHWNSDGWTKNNLWAPSILYRNGTYYFYYSAGDGDGLGLATGPTPLGPFTDIGQPLIGERVTGVIQTAFSCQTIDPYVFLDDDGQAYLYYGGHSHACVVKLNSDMRSFSGSVQEITPANYVEGPWVFKRNGSYYFMWSEGNWTDSTYSVAYAKASSPLGPFNRIGKVLESSSVATGPGHHSVFNLGNAYYIVYHRRPNGETDPSHRVTSIDRLYFNSDGTLQPVTMTFSGVPSVSPDNSTNLAIGATPSADSSCATDEGPGKAINGSVGGGNSDKWCSSSSTKWLQIDLGANKTINRFVVEHASMGGELSTYNTRDFTIQTQPDGGSWSTPVTVTNNHVAETTHPIASTTARYVRLNVSAGEQGGGGAARIYELEAYGPAPTNTTTTNMAPSGDATADSSCNGAETAYKAINGSVGGGSTDKWCSSSSSKWLQIDLGSNKTVTQIVVRHAGAGGEQTSLNTRDFTIQVQPNGGSWTTPVNVTNNTASVTTHTIPATTARYVRLNVTAGEQSGGGAARIYELEVYGQ